MKYGERLKEAIKHAKLTQLQVAERSGVTQSNISQLINSDAVGSEFTAQFADACGVSAIWLADERGDMVLFYQKSPHIMHIYKVMESLPTEEQAKLSRMVDAFSGPAGNDHPPAGTAGGERAMGS